MSRPCNDVISYRCQCALLFLVKVQIQMEMICKLCDIVLINFTIRMEIVWRLCGCFSQCTIHMKMMWRLCDYLTSWHNTEEDDFVQAVWVFLVNEQDT